MKSIPSRITIRLSPDNVREIEQLAALESWFSLSSFVRGAIVAKICERLEKHRLAAQLEASDKNSAETKMSDTQRSAKAIRDEDKKRRRAAKKGA